MGERLDALNALDDRGPAAEPVYRFDQAALAFRSASQRINAAVEAGFLVGAPIPAGDNKRHLHCA